MLPDDFNGKRYGIYAYAFGDNEALTKVNVQSGVISIGSEVFHDCKNITSITIPESVTSIGDRAFYNCRGLTSIKYCGTEDEWNAIAKDFDWDFSDGEYTITYNHTGE